MNRRTRSRHANHERWLVSYADFITLLFAFFVVMYAASQIDREKMKRVEASIEDAFTGSRPGGPNRAAIPNTGPAPELRNVVEDRLRERTHQQGIAPHDLEPLRRDLEKALEEEIKKGSITLREGPDGLTISLSELGFFDSGSSRMRTAAVPAFDRIAQLLASRRCGVRVEGHTDDRPIRTAEFKSNWDLSTARAIEIVKSLIDRYHFEPALLSAAGYGEYHPIASNETAAGRQQNRRVDLVVLSHEDAQRSIPMLPADSSVARAATATPTSSAAGEQLP